MPKKPMTAKTKSKKTKTKSKKAKAKNPKATIQRNLVDFGQGFPKRMVMTHRYVETLPLTCSSGLIQTYSYGANCLYDPNLTGAGHQPMYYDQCSALWSHYHVVGAKATFRIVHNSLTNVAARAGVYLNDDSTVTPAYIDAMREKFNNNSRVLGPGQDTPSTFSIKWSAKKTFGGSILANNQLKGTATSNPTETSCFTLFVGPLDGSSTNSYILEVVVEQIAVWSELRDLASS